jgi:hypothetical protein
MPLNTGGKGGPPLKCLNQGKQGTPNNASSGTIGLGNPNVVGGECAIGMSEERADGVDGLITHRASIDQTP